MAEETPFSSLDPLGPEYGGINSPIVDSKGLAPFEGEMLRDPKINYPKPENYFPVLPKVSNLNRPNRAIEQNVVRTNANNPSIPYSKVSPQQKKASTSQYLDAFFQTNQNKNNYAKIFSYNAGPDGNNFYKRYAAYGQETFDKIGFHPLRNNEANFNAQTSRWDDFSRMMTNSFVPLFTRGFVSGPKSLAKMLTGDFTSGDREDAKAYEEAAAIGQSNKGGVFGFANNAMMNFGYTAGIMGEAILEEIGGALLAAPTGGASLIATTANIATKLPKLSLVQKTINGYNAVKSTLKSFDSMQTARQFWNMTASNKTLSAMGRGLNPLENTLDAFKTIKNTDNITDLAALSKTAGGFYRDVRKINMALAESRLEAGMVQNSVYDKLYHEAYMAKGEAPSNKEQADLEKQAKEASMETLLANTALIYASNAITFNNITSPRGGLRNFLKSSTDDIYEIASREGAKDFGKLGKVVYDKAARQFELQKSGLITWAKGWTKDPIYKSVLGTVGYFKSNFTEGIQENLQEVIAQANERYYVDSYKSPTLQTQLYSKGVIKANLRPKKDYYSDALKDQFNSTGAETFASGFFMGALASPVNSAIPFLSSTWNRTFDKKGFTKWKEAQMSVAENLKKELNSVSMKDFMSDKVLNLGAQDMISQIRDKASKKQGLDAETEAYISHVGTMRRTGTSGLFLDTMKSFKEMDDKEFAEALKISEDQVDKYRGRIDSGIARIERVNNIFNTAERKYPNPVNLNNLGEEGTPEYEAKLITYKAWNRGIENMAFFHENYDDTKSRRAAIQNKYNNNENFKSLNSTDKLLLFQPERISDEVKMLERELATEKEGENRSAKVNALENKINLLNNYSEAHTAFDKFFNRAEYAKSVKEMLQKETGKEPTAEEISDKLDDILGSLDNEDLKVENIKKLKEAHNNYLKGVAQSNDDRIFDEHTDEGFEALIDYYKLGHESRALAEYIDMFNDPAAFMDVVQKNIEWMRKFNAQRVKYFEDLIHSEMGKVRDNAFLNSLADNQIYLNRTDMENYLGDKNIPPSEIYDGKAQKVYPAGSEEYKKIYAEYFEKRAQLKAQMNPKKTGVVKKAYQEQIDELNRKMQEEIDALPTTPTRVELDDIKRKGNNKSVSIQEVNEQLENDQYVEATYKDAITPMVFYKNTEGELLYDNAEGLPVIINDIKNRFTEAKRFKLEEKPNESEVKKIKDRYEVKIAEVMEAYNADMKAIDDEVPYEEITQDSNLDTADLVEFKQMLYNEFYDKYVVTLPQEVQDSIYGDDNIADAEFEKWYRLAENKKYFDKYNKTNKPAVSKSDITFTYEGTDVNTKDLSLPELIKYRDAINAKIELLDNNLKVNDEFEDEETVDNTKELRDLETDLKNINTIIQRRQYSGFSEEVREGVKKIQKLLTAQKGVEEKYLLTEDDSVTGLKKGEIAYRVNGLIHRRMTNAIQEVLPKKYEYAAKQGVETAFNNSIAKKGLNEDSINDFIDSLNGLLAIDKLPGTNKDFLNNLKIQLKNLSGMSPAQIKLEKQKDKLLTQIANKDIDIIKAEKAGNENRVNQLVEQKNSIFNELAKIEKEIKGLPSTTTSTTTDTKADIERRKKETIDSIKEGYNGGKTWNYIGQFSNQITKEVKYEVSQDEYTKEQLIEEIKNDYNTELTALEQPTEITNEVLSNNTTFDIIMNTFMEETYQDSRDAGNYVDDAKDYLESGVKPKFDPAKLSQEAYEDMFGLNGYLTKLKQKVDSGEFYLIGRDLVVYDSNITRPDGTKDRIAGEIDLLLATKNGIMIVDIKSGEQRKWQNFNKNSKDAKKLNYTKREEYTLQQGGYATMLERMIDYPVSGIALLPIERASNKETNQMVSAGQPNMSAPAVYNKIEFVKNEDGTYKRNEFGELIMNSTTEKASEWFIPLYRNTVQDRLDILFPPSTVKFMPGLKDKAKKEFDSYTTDLQAITNEDTEENKKELANIENKINEFAELNNLTVPEALKELLKEKQLALGKVVGKNLIDKIVTKYTNLATKSKNDVDKLVTRLAQTKSDISFDEIDLSPESAFIQEQLEKDKAFAQRFATHEEMFEGKTYKPTMGQLIAADTLHLSGIITDDEYQAIAEENYNTSDVSLLIHNSVKRIQYLSANSDTTAEAKKFKDYQSDIFNLMFSTKVNQSNTAITNALNTAQEEITAGNIKRALDIIENEVYALERTLEKTKNDNVKKTIQDKINDLNSINEAIVITTGYVEEQFIPEQEVTEGELEEFDAEEQLDKIIVKKGMTLYSKNDKFTVQTINKNNTVTLKDSEGNELTVTMDDLNKNYKTESDLLGSEAAPETAPLTKEEQEFVNQTEDSVDALLESADKTDILMAEADKIKSSEDAEATLLKDLTCK